ncbi:APC family permease [Sulfobacillus harzensis]|uniref:APC family permease n=1 Tax=Sulfobacillus harzensis TaxID=2729629 RepID=A0A7Y0Q2K0_9FIRM|nr:APC family permease [Sulfobacillus harzensis]NMP22592.1 APC family permease [Sulfobacillus harzensis]
MDIWHLLIGRPLKTAEAQSEEIGTSEGLAALSLDALTSVAYGPEAIAIVLVGLGVAGIRYLLPESLAITGLLALLVLSYSQVIDAYPKGGGAYAVSRENLGTGASHLAAAALLIDYILTVSISIAAGIGALTSAWPELLPWTVPMCLALLAVVTFLNLRGVGESARAFLLPTLLFIVGLLAVLGWGFVHPHLTHPVHPVPVRPPHASAFFLMKAFAAGCTALTGVEAIANGVPLFRKPRQLRAKRTEWVLGILLATMLIGIAALTIRFGVIPGGNQSLLSKVMAAAVGRSWAFFVVSLAITAVLGLAANTSFGGLPLLASLLARDRFLPQSFAIRGDRLVFERGIWVLAIASAILLVAVRGNTQALIPMFAIGVFTGFTLSQLGMVVHWVKTRPRGWQMRALLNGMGTVATGIATLLFVITKFPEGAWLVVVAIPLLIWMFRRVYRYYQRVGQELGIGRVPDPVEPRPHPIVVVPITPTLTELTRRALDHALSLSDQVIAVVVLFEEPGDDNASTKTAKQFLQAWEVWNPPVRLSILKSQYHSVVKPLLRFISTLERQADERVLVLIPEAVPEGLGASLLHNRLGSVIRQALRRRTDVVIGTVPMHFPDSDRKSTGQKEKPGLQS